MTFPTIQHQATSQGTATTSPSVNLPASISSGQLLVLFFANAYTITVNSTPTGWTKLNETTPTSTQRVSAYYRVADGSEGSSVSLTTGSAAYAASAFSIAGHDSSTNAPQIGQANSTFGNIDPPNLTPTGGAKDYLWLAFGMRSSGTSTFTPPTNYTELTDLSQSGANSQSVAYRNLNASSNNPGAFTQGDTGAWLAYNLAVHPGSEGVGGGGISTPVAYHNLQVQGIA